MLLDRNIAKEIFKAACTILQDYFYYDKPCLKRFLDLFFTAYSSECQHFEANATEEIKNQLKTSHVTRKHLTAYFVSYSLNTVLTNDLHFTEAELKAFDNILPKYIEVAHVKTASRTPY